MIYMYNFLFMYYSFVTLAQIFLGGFFFLIFISVANLILGMTLKREGYYIPDPIYLI